MSQLDRTVSVLDRGLLVTERGLHRGCQCCGPPGSPCCGELGCPSVPVGENLWSYNAQVSGSWSFHNDDPNIPEVTFANPPQPVSTIPFGTECWHAQERDFSAGPYPLLVQDYDSALRSIPSAGVRVLAVHALRLCTRENPLSLRCGVGRYPIPVGSGFSKPHADVGEVLGSVGLRVIAGPFLVMAQAVRGTDRSSAGISGGHGQIDTEFHTSRELDVTASYNAAGCCTGLVAAWDFAWEVPGGSFGPIIGHCRGSASLTVDYGICPPPGDGIPESMKQGANFGCVGCGG